MKKSIYTLLFIGASALSVQAQSSCVPDFLNTVAVVRNGVGAAITTPVDLKLELYQGDPALGIIIYCELQQGIQPNNFGEINVQFGTGIGICAPNITLNNLDWTNCSPSSIWYKISWFTTVNPTPELIAESNFATVPYAFLSRDAENLTVPATNGQVLTYNSALGKWVASNNDNSPTNEIQTLSVSGTNLNLSNGGGTASLLAYNAGNGISISGNTISATDNSSSNEIQTLSISGTNLNLTPNGGTANLLVYNPGIGINISGNTISATDNSTANELQTLSVTGTDLNLSNGGGTASLLAYNAGAGINISGNTISATDASATNEIQTLSVSGTDLNLSNGGGSASLLAYNTSPGSGIAINGNNLSQNSTYIEAYNPSTSQTNTIGSSSTSFIWYDVPQCTITVPYTGNYLVNAVFYVEIMNAIGWAHVGIFSGNTLLWGYRENTSVGTHIIPMSKVLSLTAGQVLTLKVSAVGTSNVDFGYGGHATNGILNTSSINILKLSN